LNFLLQFYLSYVNEASHATDTNNDSHSKNGSQSDVSDLHFPFYSKRRSEAIEPLPERKVWKLVQVDHIKPQKYQ